MTERSTPWVPYAQLGYQVTGPRGERRWLLDDGVVLIEDLAADVYRVTAPDLTEDVIIPAPDFAAAAAGVPNLIQARLHDARHARSASRMSGLTDDELAQSNSPAQELLAGMLAIYAGTRRLRHA